MENDNDTISYLKNEAQRVRLSSRERKSISDSIIQSPYVIKSHFWTYKRMVAAMVVFALFITGTGASYAAGNSLPGDPLYGIKVNVNEEVISLIAISPDAKAKVEVNRAEERLAEAEMLTVRGKMTEEKKIIIQDNLKKHTDVVKQQVVVLASEKKEEAKEVIEEFKASLEAHEAKLENLSSNMSESNSAELEASSTEEVHLSEIISTVEEAKAEIEDMEKNIEATSTDNKDNDEDKNATSTDEKKDDKSGSDKATSTVIIHGTSTFVIHKEFSNNMKVDESLSTSTTSLELRLKKKPI